MWSFFTNTGARKESAGSNELGYAERTSTLVNTTSWQTVVTASSITFSGSETVLIEVLIPEVLHSGSAGYTHIALFDNGSEAGRIANISSGSGADHRPAYMAKRVTPSAGAHVFSVSSYKSAAGDSSELRAGAGTGSTTVPAFIRITRV